MKKKDCEFKVVIADVYGVADDYIIYAYANTIEEAIEEVMTPALEKVRKTLPYEETAFVISQKKLVE